MSFRLAIDLRTLLEPYESGVTVYTKALVREFLQMEDLSLDLFYQARKRCDLIHELFPSVRHIPISNTIFHLRSLFFFPRLARSYFLVKPDLIWIPDRRPFYRTNIPLVMTIHDQVPELFAKTLSLKGRLWHWIFNLKRLLPLCSGILVPSQSIANSFGSEMPLKVTYEGVSLSLDAKKPVNFNVKRPFVLTISPGDPRKGLFKILEAAHALGDLCFVIAGLKRQDPRFQKLTLHGLKNVCFLPQFSESEKAWLLKNAASLLALSEYEGFDLPVLEAVQAKCPVIMSDIEVHRELYKEGCFVKNAKELHEALMDVIRGEGKVPIPKQDYSWEKAAQAALLFFCNIVAHKNR